MNAVPNAVPDADAAYTLLRVTVEGVVLHDQHLRRLAPAGREAQERFLDFARRAVPGIYALIARAGNLDVEERSGSLLEDGMPAVFASSPFAHHRGRIPKTAPPNPYQALRRPGISTLLTSMDGTEIYESDAAAVAGWDGSHLLWPPLDRPAVESTAEMALFPALGSLRAPLLCQADLPLILVNAVMGVCRINAPGRPPFPEEICLLMVSILERSVRRP